MAIFQLITSKPKFNQFIVFLMKFHMKMKEKKWSIYWKNWLNRKEFDRSDGKTARREEIQ